MHIHILGICGTFMGGVAQLAKALGHKVTGCDAQVYPPMSTQLEAAGIELVQGFGPEQLHLKPDLWVVGNVVSRGNPLMEAILNAGLPYTSGPQWVGEHILRGKRVLAVAGTHGKTTTSSMLAWVLDQAGLNPGFLIGGVPSGFEVSARLGSGDLFVIEADEYDTAFFDKRSKFVHYRPTVAVLNNLEYDHADIFPDLAAIETQFHHLVRTVPGNGLVVCPSQTESIERVLKRGCWTPVTRFNAQDPAADWSARIQGATRFEVLGSLSDADGDANTDAPCQVSWEMSGLHSINNALAVIAAAQGVGVPAAISCKALGSFPGVKRRMELRGEVAGVRVYDDFAHHPTAIATTLAGARDVLLDLAARSSTQSELNSDIKTEVKPGRLIAVFEPRSNTMKMGTMKAALPESLQEADAVWTYSGGVDWDVAQAMEPLGAKCHTIKDLTDMVNQIAAEAKPGDWIVVMSNGAFGGVHGKLLDKLSERAKSAQ